MQQVFTTALKVVKRSDIELGKKFKEGSFIEQREARIAKKEEASVLNEVK